MSDPANIAIMEQLSFRSDLPLRDVCFKLCSALRLPEFHFDSENETEWGIAELDHVEYNISRPYETGTLQKWNSSVPPGCNFGVSLVLLRGHPQPDHEWARENLVTPVARTIAKELSVTVHYHTTWLSPGQSIARASFFTHNDAS